ncbi:MAG: metallophosphoesterase [Oscillospiraceae bacterium]|nr:metallophosphoesterase [Oscillospiraceae bacterium]MBQ9374550.1 metallophosphoesterase [Oscillospiraceae bacterium]
MKLLIFSDSHGELSHMRYAIDREKPDYVFHLGDHDRDAEDLMRDYPTLPLVYVRGNCDGFSDTPLTRIVTLGGFRFYLCHGHTLGVKGGLLRACYAAREQRADFLLYGHTHEAHDEQEQGLHILNPGACGYGPYPTCAVVTIEGGVCKSEILEL